VLRTSLCDLLGIDLPIIQAAMAACTSAELVAAVSNAGGLGTLASALSSVEDFRRQLARAARLTTRPIAVNHSIPFFNEEAFAATLAARPAVVSFALGDPGDLVARAHDAGIKVMQMVNSVAQAERALAQRVDIINAQGTEAGGFSGTISTMILVPQVVEHTPARDDRDRTGHVALEASPSAPGSWPRPRPRSTTRGSARSSMPARKRSSGFPAGTKCSR